MKVLFLKNIKGLGKIGEVKEVNDGYAQNFLIPKKWAEVATSQRIEKLKKEVLSKESGLRLHTELLTAELSKLDGQMITLTRKVNSAGSLFGAIHVADIKEAIKNTHKISIQEEHIILSKDIKETGEFEIKLGDKKKLGKEFKLKVKVSGQ